jgi:hypothetical protein
MGSTVAESRSQGNDVGIEASESVRPPFFVTKDEERALRINAGRLSPSLVITQATSFDEYARQLMVPPTVMDLARKASDIRLSTWEIEGIRAQLEPAGGGLLRRILKMKIEADDSHPPYIRVACTGKGDYDDLAGEYGYTATRHHGDAGSPVVLEIWPAQHYSPIHEHGGTTGIIHCLTGQIDVMAYGALRWDAEKLGLLTLTPGQCAWLAGNQFGVHKVYCPMDGGSRAVDLDNLLNETSDYAATFHVYINENETVPHMYVPAKRDRREEFSFINEKTHELESFTTYSDLSWRILRRILADYAAH